MRATSRRAFRLVDFEQSDRVSDMVVAPYIRARAMAHRPQSPEDRRVL
jgi:hypothetical protein